MHKRVTGIHRVYYDKQDVFVHTAGALVSVNSNPNRLTGQTHLVKLKGYY